MNTDNDTIAAIATAGSEGCISIIRLSGPESLRITEMITRSAEKPSAVPANSILYAHVIDADEMDIDEVLLLILRGPKSYTCEDMVEIQGHGGRISAGRILRRCLECGARPAEPGEFTKRAFLNGRIDLVQAEAVQDLVKAHSEQAAKMAVEQLEGTLSRQINQIYEELMTVSADLEATLDFSEEQLLMTAYDQIKIHISLIIKEIQILNNGWFQGHVLREGVTAVIIGRPNVGKSTLLNRLLAKERAIVSPVPGTTRDTIEETMLLNGIPLRLVDTAGMRATECRIEQEGIERTWKSIERADMVLFMLDASEPLDSEINKIRKKIQHEKILFIINKADIKKYEHSNHLPENNRIELSLLNDEDVVILKGKLASMITSEYVKYGLSRAAVSERHRMLLQQASEELKRAKSLLEERMEENTLCSATHVRQAIEYVGKITGRVYYEELLNHIFSRFCIGK